MDARLVALPALPQAGIRSERDYASRANDLRPVTLGQPLTWPSGIGNVLTPEADPAFRQELEVLTAQFWPSWRTDPKFDQLVNMIHSASQQEPELRQLCQDSFTACASVAYTEMYNRAAGEDLTDPIAFGSRLISTARQMLAREDVLFLDRQEWITRGRADAQFTFFINDTTWSQAAEPYQAGRQPSGVGGPYLGYRQVPAGGIPAVSDAEDLRPLGQIPTNLRQPAQVYAGEGRAVFNLPTDDGQDQWIDISLAPGTRVETPAQALTVLVESALGIRHTVISSQGAGRDGALAGGQTWAGSVLEFATDVFLRTPIKGWNATLSGPWNWLAQTADNAWAHITSLGDRPFDFPGREALRTSSTIYGQQEQEERSNAMRAARRLEETRLADPAGAIQVAAGEMYAMGLVGTPGQAMALAGTTLAEMTPEERQTWEADQIQAAQMDAWLQASPVQKRGPEAVVDWAVEKLLYALNLSDEIAITEGVRFMDTIGDLGQVIAGALGIPLEGVTTIQSTGGNFMEMFMSNWDPAVEGFPWMEGYEFVRPSEYFEVTQPQLAFLIDAAVSLMNPLVWMFAGPGKTAANRMRLLTTREGVEEALALQAMRRTVDEVFLAGQQSRGIETGMQAMRRNPLSQIVRLTNGMPAHMQRALFDAETVDDVIRVFRDAMPGGGVGGTWIPNLAGQHMIRNTAQQIRWLTGLSIGTGRRAEAVRQFLRRGVGGFSRDRRWSVAPYQAPADYVDQIAWLIDDPVRADQMIRSFYDDLARVEQEFTVTRQTSLTRLSGAQAALRTQRSLAPAEQRAFLHRTWAGRIRPGGTSYTVEDVAAQTARAEARVTELEQEIQLLPARGLEPQRLTLEVSSRQAEIEAIRSGRWQELDRLYQEIRQIENTTAVRAAAATAGRPLRTAEQYSAIRQNMDRIRQIRNQPAMRGLASGDEAMQRMLTDNTRWMDSVRAAQHEVEEARALASRVVVPDRRRWFAERYSDLWDEVARDLELPVVEGRVNPLNGKPLYNWSPVVGESTWRGGLVEDVPRLQPVAGDDQALAAALMDAGFFRNRATWNSPASPMQVAAYRAAGSPDVWSRILGKTMQGTAVTAWGNLALNTMALANRAFLTILLSPRIAFRSAMDEVIRYLTTTGHWMGGERAIGFVDDTSAALRYTDQPGGLQMAGRQFGRTPAYSERTAWATRESFGGTFAHPTRGIDPEGWQLVGQSAGELGGRTVYKLPKLHRNSVIRWTNGTWMGDDAARALSQSVWDTARRDSVSVWRVIETVEPSEWDLTAFMTYWQDKGRLLRGGLKVTPDGVSMAGMMDGALAGRNMLRILGGNSSSPAGIIDDLIERTVLRRPYEVTDGPILRLWGPMPSDTVGAVGAGNRVQGLANAMGRGQDYLTDLMYGNPGENRWGMIHADYYDQALQILAEGNRGRIMSPSRLAELARQGKVDLGYPGLSYERAAGLYWNNHLEIIDDIAAQYGLVTTHMMENVADRFARQQAHHIMYQPGATSMLGKVLQRTAWPFGPAQYDYLSWWGSEMTRASFVGLFGNYTQIPNFLNFKAMVQGAPLGALPLNLRLAGRAMQLGGIMAHQVVDPYWDTEDAFEALSPMNFVDEFTFLPRLDSAANFILDFSPSFGPIPSLMIRLLPDPQGAEPGSWYANFGQEIRRFAETINPGVEWSPSVDLGFGALEATIDAFFPNYQGSARDLAGFLFDTYGRLPPWAGAAVGAVAGGLRGGLGGAALGAVAGGLTAASGQALGERIGYNPIRRTAFTYALSMAVAERPGPPVMLHNSEESRAWLQSVMDRAAQLSRDEDSVDTITRAMPGARLFYEPSDLATPLWQGMVDELPFLLENGLVGQNTVDNLLVDWGQYQEGTLSRQEESDLRRSLRDILIGLPDVPGDGYYNGKRAQARILLRNPQYRYPLVGRYECTVGENGLFKAPESMCTPSGTPQYPAASTDAEIADFLSAGREHGWFREINEADYAWRGEYEARQAVRQVLSDVYQGVTGRESFDPGRDIQSRDRAWFTLNDQAKRELGLCGYTDEIPDRMRGDEFALLVYNLYKSQSVDYPYDTSEEASALLSASPEAQQVRDYITDVTQPWADEHGYEHPSEYPEENRAYVRDQFAELIEKDLLGPGEYVQYFQRQWGPINWPELAPNPPLLADLDPDTRVLSFDPDDVFVIDGDTVDVMFADGATSRFRLIGVNAPDDPMPGAQEAFTDLLDLLQHEGYTELSLVFFDLDRYGSQAGTDFKTGKPRWKAWLYVDGQPIFNPAVFTPEEPLGIGPGTVYTPLPRPTVA